MQIMTPTENTNMTNVNIEDSREDMNNDIMHIQSRFGTLKISLDKMITFPSGLVGLGDKTRFCLANFPNPAFDKFKILQSVDDHELAFIILPLGDNSESLIEKSDIDECAKVLNIESKNMAMLLITSVYRNPVDAEGEAGPLITVNVRAPLIIDVKNNLGIQYIFASEKYQIRHKIN